MGVVGDTKFLVATRETSTFGRFFPAFLQVSIFDKCATEEQKEADKSVGSFGSSWMEVLS